MRPSTIGGVAIKATVIGIALLVSLPVYADPIEDPWSLVPALTSSCYSEQDEFLVKVAASLATLDEQIVAQEAINHGIGGQVGDVAAVNPFAIAQRMQEFMMNNPEEGMKMLQGMQMTGETISEDISEEAERVLELTSSIDDLIAHYRAEFAEMRAPIDAKFDALLTKSPGHEDFFTDEAMAQLPAINQQATAAYERLCSKWWKAGSFDGPLAEWRAFQTDESVPRAQELFEQTQQQFDIQGIDTSEYRSTAAMGAVQGYLQQLQRIYVERKARPTDLQIIPGG